MAALARHHCIVKSPSQISLFLRSRNSIFNFSNSPSASSFIGFHRSLCSSSSESNQDTRPNEPLKTPVQTVPIQAVSYPIKPKDQSTSEEEPLPRPSPPPRRPRQPETGSEAAATNADTRSWTREDIRYVKDVPSISPVSYPSRVAPLPEDRVAVSADEAPKEEDVQLRRERKMIESDNRIIRRVFIRAEDEKVPFPTLVSVKVENKKKEKVVLDLQEAIREIKANAKRKFDETVEAHVKLSIDPRRTDLKVSGAITLPHGTGKVVRVAVFAEGAAADEARAAGADIVGGSELIEEIKNGGIKINFNKCISTPLIMPRVANISAILNKHGLMPNPRLGTMTTDVAGAVTKAKRGHIGFQMDKSSIVHVGLGKVSFSEESLRENIGAFVNALLLAKPAGLKKTSKYAGYVDSFHLCSTMGPGFHVSIQSLSLAADRYNKLQLK